MFPQTLAVCNRLWDTFVTHSMDFVQYVEPYEQLLTPKPLFAPANVVVYKLLNAVGLPESDLSIVRFVLTLFMTIPIGLLFRFVPRGFTKHLLSICIGAYMCAWNFGSSWINLLVAASAQYFLMQVCCVIPFLRRFCHIIGVTFALVYLTVCHLVRLHTDYMGWSLDYSGAMMVMTIKLCSFAWNLFDGSDREVRKMVKSLEAKDKFASTLTERLNLALDTPPSLVAYLGHMFCPLNVLTGPAIEYSIYANAFEVIHEANVPSKSPVDKKSKHVEVGADALVVKGKLGMPLQRIPYLRVFLTFLGVLFFMGCTAYGKLFFPAADPLLPKGHPEATGTIIPASILNQNSFISLVKWVVCFAFFTRSKYYFAWLFAEVSALLAGVGYTPENKKDQWSAARNMDVIGFELAPNLSSASAAWNKGTQTWLLRYSYKRTAPAFQMLATYALSAFWHGFYPGYYLFFFSMPLFQAVEKNIQAKITPRLTRILGEKLVTCLGIILTFVIIQYSNLPFVSLGWDAGLLAWETFDFLPHILAALALIALSFVPRPSKSVERKTIKTQ